jgi:hypothetical protein
VADVLGEPNVTIASVLGSRRLMIGARRRNDTARTRAFTRRVTVVCAVAASFAAGAANAAVSYELSPAASLGATSNAQAISSGSASAFSTVGVMARVRGETPRSTESFGYRLGYTHYFVEGAQDSVGNEFIAQSAFAITQALSLSLNAAATLSRTSNVGTTNVPGQATLPGSRLYLTSTATEVLAYAVTQRFHLAQGFSVGRNDYLGSSANVSAGARPATTLGADLRGDYNWTLDTLSLDVGGGYLTAAAGTDPAGMPIPRTDSYLLQATAGWRRELSLAWWASLQLGMAGLRGPSGQFSWMPAVVATAEYRHVPWYATLVASHGPAVNLYLGVATVNDQVSLRLTLPLDRGEQVVLSGAAAYTRGRAAETSDAVAGAYDYDQISASSILSVRYRNRPFFGSLMYSVMDQRGTSSMTGQGLDVIRHTLMLNFTAAFSWGPGTPPLLGGGLI